MRDGWVQNIIRSVVGCTFLLQGCGGDPGTSALIAEFVPNFSNIPENNVNIVHNRDQSIGTRLALTIAVLSDKPVYEANFDLTFNPQVMQFIELERGNFLEATSKNGVTSLAKIQEGTDNELVVSVIQTADDPGSTGSGILTIPIFQIVGNGCSFLTFVTQDGKSQLLTPERQPIMISAWSGGTITVRTEGDLTVCVPPQSP